KAKYLFELLNTEREHDSDIEYIPAEYLKELRETRDWLQRQLKGKDLGKLYGNQAGYYLMEVSSALENLARKMGWTNDR
ncbi:hypothetical protein LCGC14_3077870, partial [marine sediment metagenome]